MIWKLKHRENYWINNTRNNRSWLIKLLKAIYIEDIERITCDSKMNQKILNKVSARFSSKYVY
jgi:hypothetical protein